MGTKNNPGDFDCYNEAAPDEPIFTLRANDPMAPIIVAWWAKLRSTARELDARANRVRLSDSDLFDDKHKEAFVVADAMRKWREGAVGSLEARAADTFYSNVLTVMSANYMRRVGMMGAVLLEMSTKGMISMKTSREAVKEAEVVAAVVAAVAKVTDEDEEDAPLSEPPDSVGDDEPPDSFDCGGHDDVSEPSP